MIPNTLDMEDSFSYNPQKCKQALQQSFIQLSKPAPNNQIISHYNSVILKIIDYLLIESNNENMTIAKLIISFISLYLKKKRNSLNWLTGENYNNMHTNHNCQIVAQKIRNIFLCETINEKTKQILLVTYTRYVGNLAPQFVKLRSNLCEFIIQFFHKSGQPENWLHYNTIMNYFYLIKAVLNIQLESKAYSNFVEQLLMKFIEYSCTLLQKLNANLNKFRQIFNNSQLVNLDQQVEWTYRVQQITQLLFIKTNVDRMPFLKQHTYLSAKFSYLISLCLQLNFTPNQQQQQQPTFFFPQEKRISSIKCSGLKILKNSLQILIKKRRQLLTNNKYKTILETIRTLLTMYVPKLALDLEKYPKIQLSQYSEQLLKITLNVIKYSIGINCFMNISLGLRNLVLLKICVPCLITSHKDQNLPAENFCKMKEDIVEVTMEGNSSKNIYEAAAEVIEQYADNIDGSIIFLFTTIINLMDFLLSGNTNYCQQFPIELSNSFYFQNETHQRIIETGLTILGFLSYHADRRKDLTLLVDDFIVRRQQFFSRIDIPSGTLVAFFLLEGYFLSNFLDLVKNGQLNRNFYRSLGFHAIEIIKATIDPNSRSFYNQNAKKIGLQALDYIENLVTQPKLFSALYPVSQLTSSQQLIRLFSGICQLLNMPQNIDLIEYCLIDFYRQCMNRHKNQQNFQHMPYVLKNELAFLLAEQITLNFVKGIKNEQMCKIKLLELFHILTIVCVNPLELVKIAQQKFSYVVKVQFSYLTEVIEIYQILIRRSYYESFPIDQSLITFMADTLVQATKVCDIETFESVIFDTFFHLSQLHFQPEAINNILLNLFKTHNQTKDIDQNSENMLEKILYLMVVNIYTNGHLISIGQWSKSMRQLLQFLQRQYKLQNSITIAKAICFCLCCYDINPQYCEQMLEYRVDAFWDSVVDDIHKYIGTLEKKIISIKLLSLLLKIPTTKTIQDRAISLLQSTSVLIYFHYEKQKLSWNPDYQQSDSQNQENSNKSKSSEQKVSWYIPQYATMRKNVFLNQLPDQISVLRDLCLHLSVEDRNGFLKFLKNLPIAVQSMIKNKVLHYREEKIRTENNIQYEQVEDFDADVLQKAKESGNSSSINSKELGDRQYFKIHTPVDNKKSKKLRNIFHVKKQF